MGKIESFMHFQDQIRSLDLKSPPTSLREMYLNYQCRNSFGLSPETKIHRITPKKWYQEDLSGGFLTLPRADKDTWQKPLENPLSNIIDTTSEPNRLIDYGALTSSFYAQCWTSRGNARTTDWEGFSHGQEAVRVSTTIGKLLDRVMQIQDPHYMHRSWISQVDYELTKTIKGIQNKDEVIERMESSGALFALSVAIVEQKHDDENEIRFLYDMSIEPHVEGVQFVDDRNLVRFPFNWEGFVDHIEYQG